MRKVAFLLAALLLGMGLRVHGAEASNPDPTPAIRQVVEKALAEFKVPGAAVAIETPDQHWVGTFGRADVEADQPVHPGDYFAIRSITKSFVVTAVLQAVADSKGGVTLDDPIGRYLRGVPSGDVITIRELANMTSGLLNYTAVPAFGEEFGKDPTRSWTTRELLDFVFKSDRPIVFPPGTRYQYSNTNTLLLGLLVERLRHAPFARVLSRDILAPSGLDAMVYLTGVELPSPAATGYQGFEDGEPDPAVINATALGFAGAMASTVADLARWGAILADGTLLPPALQAERFRARSTADDPGSPLYDRYGLGIGEVAGWWGHTGEGLGFEAAVFRQIARRETFAIVLNASNVRDVPVKIFCRVLCLLGEEPPRDGACQGERG